MTGLAVAYAGLTGLLGYVLSNRRSGWRLRLTLLVVTPAFCFLVWQAAQPPTGWPAPRSIPKGSRFAWGVVREPIEIDIWAIPPGSLRPRAYRLPYTRQLHKQVQQALMLTRGGKHVAVGPPVGGLARQRGQKGQYRFYREPPVRLPPKQ